MSSTNDLIISIVMPLVIGPLFVFFKNLWDRYNNNKQQKKKIRYETRIDEIRKKLDLFYWPILIKLKCLTNLDYQVIEKNSSESTNIVEIILDLSDNCENIDTKIRRKKKKLKRCKNILRNKGICNNVIKNEKNNKCEYCLEKNFSSDEEFDKKNKSNLFRRKVNSSLGEKEDNVKIRICDETQSEVYISEDNKNKEFTITNVNSNLLHNFDKRTIKLYKEIQILVEDNIAIIKPNIELGNELVRFMRFIEIRMIIWDTQDTEINYTKLGVVNNTDKLIKLILERLRIFSEEEKNLFEEFVKSSL